MIRVKLKHSLCTYASSQLSTTLAFLNYELIKKLKNWWCRRRRNVFFSKSFFLSTSLRVWDFPFLKPFYIGKLLECCVNCRESPVVNLSVTIRWSQNPSLCWSGWGWGGGVGGGEWRRQWIERARRTCEKVDTKTSQTAHFCALIWYCWLLSFDNYRKTCWPLIAFAKKHVTIIPDENMEIILHCRKSLLFKHGNAWSEARQMGNFWHDNGVTVLRWRRGMRTC